MDQVAEKERSIELVLGLVKSFWAGNSQKLAKPVVNTCHKNPCEFDRLASQGIGGENAISEYWDRFGEQHARSTGPRYFGFVTGGVTSAAFAADILVSALDQNVATERYSISTFIEQSTLKMLLDLLHIERERYDGVLTTGTSAANLVSLAAAREWCAQKDGYSVKKHGLVGAPKIEIYGSSVHSSIYKAIGILGLGQNNLFSLPNVKGRESIDIRFLENALSQSKAERKIVISAAGTVNTGDFDDLISVTRLCSKYNAWLHVDGAFGAFARCLKDYEHLAGGLEYADSFTLDGHKWLNTPYDCGAAFIRHKGLLEASFSATAPYVPMDGHLPAYMNRGIEQSRRYRALPLFINLKAYGRDGVVENIASNCKLARDFSIWIKKSRYFQLMADTYLNIVFFRGLFNEKFPSANEMNIILLRKINDSGNLFITPTTYNDNFVFRLAISNWDTTDYDIELVKQTLVKAYKEVVHD